MTIQFDSSTNPLARSAEINVMDEQTKHFIQELLDMHRDMFARVNSLSALMALHEQVVLRLVAKTDLLQDLTGEEREIFEIAGAASSRMADLSQNGESARNLLEVIQRRIGAS
jgi:hypothetical protein